MCRLLQWHSDRRSRHVEKFDEAPCSLRADRAYQRLLRALAKFDDLEEPSRQLGRLNQIAALNLTL